MISADSCVQDTIMADGSYILVVFCVVVKPKYKFVKNVEH